MTPVRLLKKFSDMYAYSFCKKCHPVRRTVTCTVIKDCTFIREVRVDKIVDTRAPFLYARSHSAKSQIQNFQWSLPISLPNFQVVTRAMIFKTGKIIQMSPKHGLDRGM